MRRSMGLACALVAGAISMPGCFSAPAARAPEQITLPTKAPPKWAARPAAEAQALEPPLSLTASDGTGLTLVSLHARAVIQDPLAFTEIRLVFENPEDRVLEGTFSVTLPQGATLSRLAMRIGDRYQEGEIVPRQMAREAYEDFLHQKQDPALLERAAANAYSARVFPIPARGHKELILSYSQELTESSPYVLPLRGLPQLRTLDAAVTVAGREAPAQALRQVNTAPRADFVLPAGQISRSAGLRNGDLALLRVRPVSDPQPDPLAPTLVLIDTSASRALGFEEEIGAVGQLVQRLAAAGPTTPLSVICYDQTAQPMFDGDAGGFGERDLSRIRDRQALGASNLERALELAARRARMRGLKRVILITDGVVTAGALETDRLRAAAANLASGGVERMDVLAMGAIRDDAILKELVTAGLPRTGIVADLALGMDAIEDKLTAKARAEVPLRVDGARFFWPRSAKGVQAGDEVLVYAEVPADKPVKLSIDGAPAAPVTLDPVERPLLQRAWAKAKIDSLLEREGAAGASAETERAIVALSTANRVLSPYTSLLVLETEADYERWNIQRRSLGDILTVADGRIEVARRSLPDAPGQSGADADASVPTTVATATRPPAPPRPGSSQLSAARSPEAAPGQRGVSASAQGQARANGQGRANIPARAVRPPQFRMGETSVIGRVPPEAIQRVVRLNFGRFRRCYEDGLRANSKLEGRVVTRFVINTEGTALGATNAGSDLPDTAVIGCVVRVFGDLQFPGPDSGIITVVYPIAFGPERPAEEASPDGTNKKPEVNLGTHAPHIRTRYIPEPVTPLAGPSAPEKVDPYTGRFKGVMSALAGEGGPADRASGAGAADRASGAGAADRASGAGARAALALASAWHKEEPGDVMGLIALGEALEATGEFDSAARAYGSLIDLFPGRADLRRFAGERLERVRGGLGLDLAADTYKKAALDRPDHPAGHRLLAFARLKQGAPEAAFNALVTGLQQPYSVAKFGGALQILREDLGLIAAAWIKAEPGREAEITKRLSAAGGALENEPSLRFVLNWETDANDVDFHIYDATGGHAYFGNHRMASGGELYADITTGYGPECFTVRLRPRYRSEEYRLQAHYYSRGPMGYGMGKLQIIDHDGSGGLKFDERPFVVMADRAFVDLGSVRGSLDTPRSP